MSKVKSNKRLCRIAMRSTIAKLNTSFQNLDTLFEEFGFREILGLNLNNEDINTIRNIEHSFCGMKESLKHIMELKPVTEKKKELYIINNSLFTTLVEYASFIIACGHEISFIASKNKDVAEEFSFMNRKVNLLLSDFSADFYYLLHQIYRVTNIEAVELLLVITSDGMRQLVLNTTRTNKTNNLGDKFLLCRIPMAQELGEDSKELYLKDCVAIQPCCNLSMINKHCIWGNAYDLNSVPYFKEEA